MTRIPAAIHGLITTRTYVVVKAANEFHTKTICLDEMWQTDFTYVKIIGWGCLGIGMLPCILCHLRDLSTVLDAVSQLGSGAAICVSRTALKH